LLPKQHLDAVAAQGPYHQHHYALDGILIARVFRRHKHPAIEKTSDQKGSADKQIQQ
jgi:hypothetical protein